jgi:hypothetical protein
MAAAASGAAANCAVVLGALRAHGLLVLHDAKLATSAVTIIAGAPVKGSWWSHPLANEIFRVVNEAADDPDVVVAKLVDGKVTLVDRRLWPALLAVAVARAAWQLQGLSPGATALLKSLRSGRPVEATGAPAKELEARLLARGEQVHTPSGKHVTRLESWTSWARRVGCTPATPEEGRRALERAVADLGGGPERLPWNRGKRRR